MRETLPIRRVEERTELEAYLRRDPIRNLYALGDLDPFYWPHTVWYGLGRPLEALVLGYLADPTPVFLALVSPPQVEATRRLVKGLETRLPRFFYAHLSEGVELGLDRFQLNERGRFLRMGLAAPELLKGAQAEGEPLDADRSEEVVEFYRHAYPGHWFVPRMLESNRYFGIRRQGRLVAVAGVHVYAPGYGVAALGNIATLPKYRGQGLGQAVTARLGQVLLQDVTVIGLNVQANNQAALRCYENLGFRVFASYFEYECRWNATAFREQNVAGL